jgi:hypothetical protein
VHALELQCDDLLELFLGNIVKRLEQPPAGGVDGDIDLAVAFNRGGGQRLDLLLAGDVAYRPVARDGPGKLLQTAALRPATTTLAPASASAWAMCWPILASPAAPRTTATLPERLAIASVPCAQECRRSDAVGAIDRL